MATGSQKDPRQYYADTEQPVIEKVLHPFNKFFQTEATSGIVLMLSALAAMVLANSAWADQYFAFFERELSIGFKDFMLTKPLHLWVNEGLMSVFFFVVGLEIKREVIVGELSDFGQAMLPISAALGGMVAPALVYLLFNPGAPQASGWGVPMATDIAFALGVLVLIGKRVPLQLKIFLTAVAIVDDIGAVLVIALFYTAKISWIYLGIALVPFAFMLMGNLTGVRSPLFYALGSIVIWVLFLKSGVHATVEGVLAALVIPARVRCSPEDFLQTANRLLQEFKDAAAKGASMLTNKEQHSALQALEEACQHAEPPMQRLEHALVPWSAYLVMPVFALANAGVPLDGGVAAAATSPVAVGIIAGLVIGKQIGILGGAWLVVKAGLCALPPKVTWRHVHGTSLLAGIGFTMSLFISQLAFAEPQHMAAAKVGIILASLLATLLGWLVLRRA